jgi:hypothetical protein
MKYFIKKAYGSTECSKAVPRYVRYGLWAPRYSFRFLTNSSQRQSSHLHDLQSQQHAMAKDS